MNGDALDDVVVVGPTGAWVILRQAGGGLAAPQPVATSLNLTDVALGDFNADGRTDIAVAGTTGARVLLQSVGSFSFAAGPGSPIVTGSLESIVAGRFDGDGTLDIAASRPGDDRVVIRLGNASAPGAFVAATPPDILVSDNPGALAAADFDLNGTTDLVVAHRLAADAATKVRDRATILSGGGNGAFSPSATINVYEAGQADQTNEVRSIVVADIDGDGRPDLLFADFALSAAIMARNTSIVVLPPVVAAVAAAEAAEAAAVPAPGPAWPCRRRAVSGCRWRGASPCRRAAPSIAPSRPGARSRCARAPRRRSRSAP